MIKLYQRLTLGAENRAMRPDDFAYALGGVYKAVAAAKDDLGSYRCLSCCAHDKVTGNRDLCMSLPLCAHSLTDGVYFAQVNDIPDEIADQVALLRLKGEE